MLKAILFDLHGILVTKFPKESYMEKVKELFKAKGVSFDFKVLKEKYGTLSFATYKLGFRHDYIKMLNTLPVSDDKDEELISILERIGQKMYIVTDTPLQNCLDTLEHAGIDDGLFDGIFTADDVKIPKPDTELYKLVLKEGFKPEECLVIGDRLTDIVPAYELGMGGLVCNYDTFKGVLNGLTTEDI